MKPLLSAAKDGDALQDLGKATAQITHDLKNQLNGLKLYATFLRKRFEKSERPADEQETVNKLINGLQRLADDLSTIVQYGREIEPKTQPDVDIQKIMQEVRTTLSSRTSETGDLSAAMTIESEPDDLLGEFDPIMLTNALSDISVGAFHMRKDKAAALRSIIRKNPSAKTNAIIDFPDMTEMDHDPFHSFIGSREVRMSLAAKIVSAHGGSVQLEDGVLRVQLPLTK